MRKIGVIFFVLAFTCVASAGTITSVVVYGDSLSDNGNLFLASGNTYPPAPYYNGRMSNGPVAVESLATTLGVPLFDFAWIGATSGIGNHVDHGTPTSFGSSSPTPLPGMQTMALATQGIAGALAPSALFVVWGGPNDFLDPSPLDGGDPFKIADRAVADILSIVAGLTSLGADQILVPGMPDLGLTPYYRAQGPLQAAGASFITDYFNSMLVAGLPSGVTFFDTAGAMRSIVANPSAFGFTNVSDACFNGTSVCSNPDQYVFFDDFHPTTAAHAILGQDFAAAVPEPATCVLVLTGALAALRKRRFA
jgi:cholinesterase